MLECLVSSMPLEDQRSVKKGLNDFEVVSHVVDEDMDDDGAFFVRVEALSGAHSVHGICWWKNIHNTIIVHLLGRVIGYKTLLTQMDVMWVPIGDIQLIDLESNYFVRFSIARVYIKVLTDGPLTIYRSYLTMQP
ncbi:hypothetical protein V6N12_068278 [Hibiscus sabdariffa]|uniref:DUF4283 domain-containing protein n=1 Tax=Hibiscus sabdariffa TaxID=183260 RepID=A0ABR2FPN8_9ROSI